MTGSTAQFSVVRKARRSRAQKMHTTELSLASVHAKELRKSLRRSKRKQPRHHGLPETPMKTRSGLRFEDATPIEPLLLNSPPPSKAQYAALKQQRDHEHMLRLVAEDKVGRLSNVRRALRRFADSAKNAQVKATECNKTLNTSLSDVRRDLEISQKLHHIQEARAQERIQHERVRTKRWRARSDRYRKRHIYLSRTFQRRIQKGADQAAKVYLTRKGVYTPETRRLV